MDIQEVLKLADYLIVTHTGEHLDDLQKTILEGVWQGQKYFDIAENIPCSEGHVRDTASDLWKILSTLSGEEVNKSNLKSALERLQISISSSVANVGINNHLSLCGDLSKNSKSKKENNTPRTKEAEKNIEILLSQDMGEIPDLMTVYGRLEEISTLENYILEEKCRLIGIIGVSGIGKTVLSRYLLEKIKQNFDCVIWKNLNYTASLSTLLRHLIFLLSAQTNTNFFQFTTSCKISLLDLEIGELLSIFYRYLREYRCLVVLDNVQIILAENELAGIYQNQFANYREFFKNIGKLSHNSCLLFNSWESPLEIIDLTDENKNVKLFYLDGMAEHGREIFKQYNLLDEEHWSQLINIYQGNPYHLKIVARMIYELFNGKVELFLSYNSLFIGEEIMNRLKLHWQKLSSLEKQTLTLLGEMSLPATVTEIIDSFTSTPPATLFQAIQSLHRRKLIEKIRQDQLTCFTVSPVIKEYLKIVRNTFT